MGYGKRWIAGALVLLMTGCASYYKVTDPTTGRIYYTSDLKQSKHGTVTLKDARTGNKVTIQNSEVDQVSKEEYETGKNAVPSTAPMR